MPRLTLRIGRAPEVRPFGSRLIWRAEEVDGEGLIPESGLVTSESTSLSALIAVARERQGRLQKEGFGYRVDLVAFSEIPEDERESAMRVVATLTICGAPEPSD